VKKKKKIMKKKKKKKKKRERLDGESESESRLKKKAHFQKFLVEERVRWPLLFRGRHYWPPGLSSTEAPRLRHRERGS